MCTKKIRNRDSKKDFLVRALTGAILIVLTIILFFYLPPIFFSLTMIISLLTILLTEWPKLFSTKDPMFWLLAPIYPVFPFYLVILLNHSPYRILILVMAGLAFSFDFGSYAFGSLFGMHKIAPKISPRKTWEGAIGGFMISYAVVTLILHVKKTFMPLLLGLTITLFITTIAFFGDLFESWLKRKAGIKDTSSLLPGHGGLLDRFDSILFLAPLFYFFRNYLAKIFGLI